MVQYRVTRKKMTNKNWDRLDDANTITGMSWSKVGSNKGLNLGTPSVI